MKQETSKNHKIIPIVIFLCITVLLTFIIFYFGMPTISIHSVEIPFIILLYVLVDLFCIYVAYEIDYDDEYSSKYSIRILLSIAIAAFAFLIIGGCTGARMFNASKYASSAKIEKGTIKDIPKSTDMKKLFLTDTKSAKKLCERVLGKNSDYASQYKVGTLTQCVYMGESVKIAPLEYDGFFKWVNNKSHGIPAYIIVKNDEEGKPYAKLVELDKGLKYIPSACFSQYIKRDVHFNYPSYFLNTSHLEIDENGTPYYITPYTKPTIGLYSGSMIQGIVITDPVTGKCTSYKIKDIPSWVDLAIDGDTISKYYNWYGVLRNGFWNSHFGQRGCVHTTDDFGYVTTDDGADICIFTGVTSITDDSSNIGFLLANERTGKMKYITCDGADEHSAMGAAEGELQEKGYTASFPSLITVENEPTYVMILKDKNRLTKDYACVNVKRYDQVAVASDPDAVFEKYRKLLGGEISQEEAVKDTSNSSETTTYVQSEDTPNTKGWNKEAVNILVSQNIVQNGTTYIVIRTSKNETYSSTSWDDILAFADIRNHLNNNVIIYTKGKSFTLDKEANKLAGWND